MKFLIAEDESFILDFFLNELQINFPEHNFKGASNGLEAFQIMENETFDYLITDGKMPKLSGVDLVKRLREGEISTKAILLTGFPGDFEEEELRKIGIIQIFEKPVRIEKLLDFIKDLS